METLSYMSVLDSFKIKQTKHGGSRILTLSWHCVPLSKLVLYLFFYVAIYFHVLI